MALRHFSRQRNWQSKLRDYFPKRTNYARRWQWALPIEVQKEQIELLADGFILRQGGYVMRLRFVTQLPLHLEVKGVGTTDAMVQASYRDRKNQGDFTALITLDTAETAEPEVMVKHEKDGLLIEIADRRYRIAGSQIEVMP